MNNLFKLICYCLFITISFNVWALTINSGVVTSSGDSRDITWEITSDSGFIVNFSGQSYGSNGGLNQWPALTQHYQDSYGNNRYDILDTNYSVDVLNAAAVSGNSSPGPFSGGQGLVHTTTGAGAYIGEITPNNNTNVSIVLHLTYIQDIYKRAGDYTATYVITVSTLE